MPAVCLHCFAYLVLGSLACSSPGAGGGPTGPRGTVVIAGRQLYLPPGFSINLFAQGLAVVRCLALGPHGAVYASLSDDGTIARLVDASGDGVADSVTTVLAGLEYPFDIAFCGDTMCFAEMTMVKRLDPGATAPTTLVSNLPSGGHVTRTLVFGSDNLMYVAIGSSCNVCDESDPRRAAVVRYHLDGSGEHVFARGLRHSVGPAVNRPRASSGRTTTTATTWATTCPRST